MIKLKVRNLSKTFTMHNLGGIPIKGFEDVSFDVKKGEFLSLFGPSGMGKSSILKSLYRTYITSNGDIVYAIDSKHSINISKASESEILALRKNEIGYISQFLHVLPRISCVNIVAEPLIEKGESENSAKEKAREMLSYLSIKEELFDISPLTFSGGEQQRVNIAKGIIAPKSLLLLDEPTASLDNTNTQKVIDKFQELKRCGVTMVGIFHSKDAMEQISDTIYNVKEKTLCNL